MTSTSSQMAFPPRKRRPSAGSFVTPNISDNHLIQSLLILTQDISSLEPIRFLLRNNFSSIVRKVNLLTFLFEDLVKNPSAWYSPSAILCFRELYILLQRIKTMIEDCSSGSKMWLLLQNVTIANTIQELTVEMFTLLDIFPVKEMNINEDVYELVGLIKKQCGQTNATVDPMDLSLKIDVLNMLEMIREEIIPDQSKLSEIFIRLNLTDSSSCREEMENLEEEVQIQTNQKSKSIVVSLIGFVRYTKCVLYGESTPPPPQRNSFRRRRSMVEDNIPTDFRCPISLDLMTDPVVVCTGQTYDRESITAWIQAGHATCPKSGQNLAHSKLIPNTALKNLISMWCRQQRIPLEKDKSNDVVVMEATRMTVLFLVNKLTENSNSFETANNIIHELRNLAKSDSDSRSCIVDAGALPLFVKFLRSDHPDAEVNSVTAILNLSILEENREKIMKTDGILDGVVYLLRNGATWEAKGNAAATLFSLSSVHSHRKRLGRKKGLISGLLELARLAPGSTKKDALAAILSLAGEKEALGKLVQNGIMEVTSEMIEKGLPEEAVMILETMIRRGGAAVVGAAFIMIRKLATLIRNGTDRSRESAAATLVNICRIGGPEMVVELASVPGIERMVWEMMGMMTGRGRRKAASLLRILRKRKVGVEGDLNIMLHPSLVAMAAVR
ncbi:U-box domain-containing protein 16-like [Impatiens glandulifera]|uniref:U-box domain-containing protein 16-like n=1 Tax=Impatiens glandulifera TaxID=253017 RepID=UPI001FB10590|nr:U-box domain-containing protein 16-like [Impatiens glandulifera]